MASLPKSRPFYASVWFSLIGTVVAVLALFLMISRLDLAPRDSPRAIGQIGVVALAAYWAFVFPQLRKIGSDDHKADPNPPRP